jgi:hypothetical protein
MTVEDANQREYFGQEGSHPRMEVRYSPSLFMLAYRPCADGQYQ